MRITDKGEANASFVMLALLFAAACFWLCLCASDKQWNDQDVFHAEILEPGLLGVCELILVDKLWCLLFAGLDAMLKRRDLGWWRCQRVGQSALIDQLEPLFL